MITVTFETCYSTIEPIAKVPTLQEAWKAIEAYLAKINFQSYYYRTWDETPTKRKVDYGSHSEFFLLENDVPWCDIDN